MIPDQIGIPTQAGVPFQTDFGFGLNSGWLPLMVHVPTVVPSASRLRDQHTATGSFLPGFEPMQREQVALQLRLFSH